MTTLTPLKLERLKKGITQRELARRLGLTSAEVSNWETGYARCPVETRYRIAKELGVTVEILFPKAEL